MMRVIAPGAVNRNFDNFRHYERKNYTFDEVSKFNSKLQLVIKISKDNDYRVRSKKELSLIITQGYLAIKPLRGCGANPVQELHSLFPLHPPTFDVIPCERRVQSTCPIFMFVLQAEDSPGIKKNKTVKSFAIVTMIGKPKK